MPDPEEEETQTKACVIIPKEDNAFIMLERSSY